MIQRDELYMRRCIQLAKLGAGTVAPNPMVGAVLVYENSIIGEGYHQKYGEAHAEVNCIDSVKEADKQFMERSTLYVSLEPCAHFGKTPPCSDLLIRKKIPKVIIGCRDPFKEVDGKGIEKLKAAGAEVVTGILETACKNVNKRFFTFHTQKRPYIILKWAQAVNKIIATNDDRRLIISNKLTDRLVHKWRHEAAAILVGTNTAIADNPYLTNRLWAGKNPVRLVIDKNLKLPLKLKIFNADAPTIVFNYEKHTINPNQNFLNQVYYYRTNKYNSLVQQIAKACYELNIQSVLVEGGAKLLQSFIDENICDEIRIITNKDLVVKDGLPAPVFGGAFSRSPGFFIQNDEMEFFFAPEKKS
ncbi:bifunctional diaminohydroxyphosphoribosylaminopyrimidine deaminase/5-amino-6-(5-phosphoribosylamino)uracil reductase RibD [Parafilimonas sp.]|uniref:bifunctional diaminohydroxyphosphoribosylaminopyrimidine deaminase/5-amino-6-(5-phosphoribosylamino)uracil reductase RibD n=1 Tax=Parafilimonas sp. TaxID=1969739 RepID=UPI0039E26568